MKRIFLIVMTFLFVPNAYCSDGLGGYNNLTESNNINIMVGQKQLDSKNWDEFNRQLEYGILYDYKGDDWLVSFTIELFASEKKKSMIGVDFSGNPNTYNFIASTREYCVGVKKIWDFEGFPIKPFIGGGIASIFGKKEMDGGFLQNSDSDSVLGYWASGGAYVSLADKYNLGFMVRYSKATVTLFDEEQNAGGTHAGIFVGYHW